MDQQKLIVELKDFLRTEPACVQTLSCLKPEAKIQISIANTNPITVFYDGSQVVVEDGSNKLVDFIFNSSPQAIETLLSEKGLSPAQLGIKLLKQVLTQDVSISMPSNIFHITRKGYLDILKVGGLEFLNELKNQGLTSLPKILSALKKLRS